MSADAPLTVGALMELARRRSSAEFVRELGQAVLVAPTVAGSGAEEDDGWSYQTAGASTEDGQVINPMTTFRDSLVLPLRKARAGPFANTVLVGRAASNDVCVPDDSVSKLHARVRVLPGGVELSDAGSRNGTRVNGKRLAPGEAVSLRHGDDVTFGHRGFKVYTTARLHEIFREMED